MTIEMFVKLEQLAEARQSVPESFAFSPTENPIKNEA